MDKPGGGAFVRPGGAAGRPGGAAGIVIGGVAAVGTDNAGEEGAS